MFHKDLYVQHFITTTLIEAAWLSNKDQKGVRSAGRKRNFYINIKQHATQHLKRAFPMS